MMDDLCEVIDPLLGAPPPVISCTEAENVLLDHFGIAAQASLLSSERDGNFRMRSAGGADYLLKFSNAEEQPEVANLQTRALRHLERHAPHLPVPRLIAARDGRDESPLVVMNGGRHLVRLMSYLPGVALASVSEPVIYRAQIPKLLAELNLGLADFDHPAATHDLLWDAAKALRVRPLCDAVHDRDQRDVVMRMLDEYEAYAAPRLPQLRTQVIHNDFNPSNILVAEGADTVLTGIIDFGDVIRAPLVSEVATAMAYQPVDDGDALGALVEFVSGYHRVLPLMRQEIDVVLDLVRARQVIVIAITAWRAARQPDNSDYILRNAARAWRSLNAFGALSRSEVQAALWRACSMEQADE